MKKKYLFTPNAKKWNTLLRKFLNLHKRIKTGNFNSEQQMNCMSGKLQSIYKRLEKMQYRVGIKLAGSALALMLMSATGYSQDFTSAGKLKGYPTSINVGDEATPIFADLDNDTDLDLYVGCASGTIKVFTDDGTGIFYFDENIQADGNELDIGYHSNPAFADIDGDGDLDLYVGEQYGYIKVFINDGNGNFTSAANLQADGVNVNVGYWSSPEFADIDDDGDLDLYAGNYDGYISVFTNDGTGTFLAAGNLQADGVDIDTGGTPVFADVDDDNDLDLYAGCSSGTVSIFINDGSGNFLSAGNIQVSGTDIDIGSFSNPIFEDIDGDSDLDLYLGAGEGSIFIFSNDGSNNFSNEGKFQAHGTEINIGYMSIPEFADIDDDGDLDLFVGGYEGNLELFTNNGIGSFSSEGNIQVDGNDYLVEYNSSPAFADLDGDGDLDLYVGIGGEYNIYSGFIKVFTNDGSNNFSDAGYMQAYGSDIDVGDGSNPEFADIDDDGDLDLYVGEKSGAIEVFLNNGSNSFSAVGNLQADGSDILVDYAAIPAFADIDNDGDLDLYVGESGGYIKVFTNDGNGNFSAVGNLQADDIDIRTDYTSSPSFADIDEDGDLDLYSGNLFGFIEVFINNGSNIIKDNSSEPEISIYPNPSNGIFTIETADNYNVSVINISGKLVKEFIINNSHKSIDMGNQPTGVYFLKFSNEKTVKTLKIIIE